MSQALLLISHENFGSLLIRGLPHGDVVLLPKSPPFFVMDYCLNS